MRACPAGNGKGACACDHRFPTSGFRPSPREDIGATNEAMATERVSPQRETFVAVSHLQLVSGEHQSAVARGLTHHSSQREKVFEHLFLSRLGLELIARGVNHEVLHGEVDDHGYDLAIEAGGIMRHVQLKVTIIGGARADVGIHMRLTEKPSGCVIWLAFDPVSRDFQAIRWFGGRPGERLPDLGSRVGRHTRGNSAGVKARRPAIRIVPASRFDQLEDFAHLADCLFGMVPADPLAFLYSRIGGAAASASSSLLSEIMAGGFSAIPESITFDNGGVELAGLINGYRMLGLVGDEQPGTFVDRQRAAHAAGGQWQGDAVTLWTTLFLETRADHLGANDFAAELLRLDQLCRQLRKALTALENGHA